MISFLTGLFFFISMGYGENSCDFAKKDPSASIGQLSVAEGFCTGVLISPHVVLTAAHCVKSDAISELKFTLKGIVAEGDNIPFAGVAEVIVHPTYWRANDGSAGGIDLALVKLKDKNYGPVPMIYPQVILPSRVKIGETLFSWGYGINEIGAKGTRRKKEVHFDGYDSTLSKDGRKLEKVRLVFSRGETGEIQCFGDSGGPVMTEKDGKWWVVGINSRGGFPIRFSTREGLKKRLSSKEFLCEKSNTFRSVAVGLFSGWIADNLKKLETEKIADACGF